MKVGTAALVLLAAGVAWGGETKCTMGKSERRIEVVYAEGTKAPCEVKYTKDGAETQTLWTAQNDAAYCGQKAAELLEKLQGAGWQCQGDGGAGAGDAGADAGADAKAGGEAKEGTPEKKPE